MSEAFQDIHQFFAGEIEDISAERIKEFRKLLLKMTVRVRNSLQEADSEDIVQEATIKLMYMAKNGVIHSNIVGAAYWVIKGIIKDNYQNNSMTTLNEQTPSPLKVEEATEKTELLNQLKEAVANLSTEEQELLYQRYVLGIKIVDIAKRENIQPNTLTTRHKRILIKLRKAMSEVS
jgi:RNA polymerase sigma factor (sigma-70 family)